MFKHNLFLNYFYFAYFVFFPFFLHPIHKILFFFCALFGLFLKLFVIKAFCSNDACNFVILKKKKEIIIFIIAVCIVIFCIHMYDYLIGTFGALNSFLYSMFLLVGYFIGFNKELSKNS